MVGATELAAGAISIGISSDEPTHVLRTQTWIDTGWYLPDFFLFDGQPGTAANISAYAYGPAFSGFAHALNVILGNETLNSTSASGDAWMVRHLAVAAVGAATSFAVGLAIRATTGSWRFAAWGAAALLMVPLWTGMSFFNPKDVPAAAGYTFTTVGLVLALTPGWLAGRRWWRIVSIVLLVAGGVFLGMGTRLALWAPLLISLATWAAIMWMRSRADGFRSRVSDFVAVSAGASLGIAVLLVTYPSAFTDPLAFLTESIADSADYPWEGFTLTAGRLLSDHPPWWYLPVWGFASVPVLIFLLALVGGGDSLRSIIRELLPRKGSWIGRFGRNADLALLLVLLQALMLPIGSMIIGSTAYTGFRQHLYVVPALAILAGVGASRLWVRFGRDGTGRGLRGGLLTALLSLALIIPMAEGVLLFPYNYTYINPVAGLGGINDRWETDYWWSSSREALDRVPAGIEPLCTENLFPLRGDSLFGVLAEPCHEQERFEPYLDGRRGPATVGEPGGQYSWLISRQRSGGRVPDFCREEDAVTRWVRGEEVVMARVLRCRTADLVMLDES